jgi:hypothetical protein
LTPVYTAFITDSGSQFGAYPAIIGPIGRNLCLAKAKDRIEEVVFIIKYEFIYK